MKKIASCPPASGIPASSLVAAPFSLAGRLAGTLVAVVSLAGCVAQTGPDDVDSLPAGAPMPQFSLSGPAGSAGVSTDDLEDVRTLVILFRTTCPDCARELPKAQKAWEEFEGETDFRLVAISGENEATVAEYWQKNGYTMPWYIDSDGGAFARFEVRRVPTLYLFGSDGRVAYVAVETFDSASDKLVELIKGLI